MTRKFTAAPQKIEPVNPLAALRLGVKYLNHSRQVAKALRDELRASAFFVLLLLVAACGALLSCTRSPEPRPPFASVRTLAGAQDNSAQFGDPFGVTVAQDKTIYVSDGETGRIWQIAPDGATKVVAENLNAPSAIALTPSGALVVADTGSHTIKRIEPQQGSVVTIAGAENRAGFADGSGTAALFNGPVGVAVSLDGTIFVADTYNDRIRAIDTEGRVRTLAGGDEPGYADAPSGLDARFDTPCGIAVDTNGTLVVADTGNHRLRRVTLDGAVTTIDGTSALNNHEATPEAAFFNEPIGVAIDADSTIYVTDAAGSEVRVLRTGLWRQVYTLAGYRDAGLADGTLDIARLSRPSGIAISPDGTLVIADCGNRLVRALLREDGSQGVELTREQIEALRPEASAFRAQAAPRWPYDPPERAREIAATFGEIRGEIGHEDGAWFHNGLDIPGAYGETVRLVRSEKILRPLAVEGVNGARERIRFPTLGYVHLRVGRDQDDRAFDDERFVLRRDDEGEVTGVRVRRGTQFKAGDPLGTLNNQNHVHLVAGFSGSEFNALAALELPGVKDTVAPVIEKEGVRLFDRTGKEFESSASSKKAKSSVQPIIVRDAVRIVVRAYDQMDGNAARRRLGLYRLGYQVLKENGSPAPGFPEPLVTISFESLPDDGRSAPIAYAWGSKSGATGETIFAYIVTNKVRDRAAAEDYWHTSQLPEGDYILRVFVADFFGNRTTRDTFVRVERG
jgi:DNA-binding beta-propeller fold protein YncE